MKKVLLACFIALVPPAAFAAPKGLVMNRAADLAGLEEKYIVNQAWPDDWVRQQYAAGYVIHDLWVLDGSWVVLMRKGSSWTQQQCRRNTSDAILGDFLKDGYLLTSEAYLGKDHIWVVTRQAWREGEVRFVEAYESLPEVSGKALVRAKYFPLRVESTPSGTLTRPARYYLAYGSYPTGGQEWAVRTDPTAFFERIADLGMILTTMERRENQWLLVATKLTGPNEQIRLSYDEAQIKQRQAEGFKIAFFY